MKLKNKLLPLVGISAVAATVAPIALTSCGNKENMIDLLKYESKLSPLDPAVMTEAKAAENYFGANNATEIIQDDILTLVSTEAYFAKLLDEYLPSIIGYEDATFDMQTAEAAISNLGVKYTAGTNKALISGNIHLKLVSKIYEKDHKGEAKYLIGTYTLETHHNLNGMPYTLWYGSNDYLATGISDSDLKSNKDWSFSRSYAGSLVYDKNTEPSEYATQSDNWYNSYITSGSAEQQKTKLAELQAVLQYVKWTSTYLSQISK